MPDLARASKDDPQYYTGSLWLMATGSWKVRVDVEGARGKGRSRYRCRHSLRACSACEGRGAILLPLGLLLVFGLVAVVGASVREAQQARQNARRRAGAPCALGDAGRGGDSGRRNVVRREWWKSAAGDYASYVYKPLGVKASVESGNQLVLQLDDPGWLNRRTDDLLPDHNHLMHLYVIHLPEMDRSGTCIGNAGGATFSARGCLR